jgi:hypothetical protein
MNHPDLLIEQLTQERDEARAALAAAEQAARAAWVPVTERLPEEDANVLVYVPVYGEKDSVCGAIYCGAKEGWRGCEWIRLYPSHWMPKPLPPSPVAGGPGGAERSKA